MRIGIMSFAHLHAEGYVENLRQSPGVEFIGFSEPDSAAGTRYAAQFDAHWFPSHEQLLAEKPDGGVYLFRKC